MDEIEITNGYRTSRRPTNEMSGSYTNRLTTQSASRGQTTAIPVSNRGFSGKTQSKIAKVISETPQLDVTATKENALSNLLNSRR